MNRVVGDFRQDRVDRDDQKIDAEYGGNPRKRRRQPGQRMPSEAEEGSGSERDQDQVAGIGSDARQHPYGHQDSGHRLARRYDHDLLDQGVDQAGLLGQPDADHHH